ncbi:helix-turn-helix domain-containing protein [Marinobacter nauticus]|uniref:helix-turn-helix domain-containing protein n=1 Tax=Marinobacter nauticus TaxID=2743 RepID=UPI0035169437
MNLGSAIEQCRVLKGYTKSKLAQDAGISISYLTLIIQGEREPTLASIEKISEALGIPASLLVFLASGDELSSLSKETRSELKQVTSELIKASSERSLA